MMLNMIALLIFILSLFLFSYAIRSFIFILISKKYVSENKYLLPGPYHSTCKSLPGLPTGSNEIRLSRYLSEPLVTVQKSLTEPINPLNNDIPYVSVVVPMHNERLVVDRLMRSCAALTYDRDRFEIIVIDDSNDGTLDLLKSWEPKIPNLRVIHRRERKGWKGGALNEALKKMNSTSSYVLVADADILFVNDTLQKFVLHFSRYTQKCNCVIQGFPLSKAYPEKYYSKHDSIDTFMTLINNWVASAIDFRIAQRNIVEFLAKNCMNLPVQVTGSLFMIRSEIIKALTFSNDLTEDWDLTLDLSFHPMMRTNDCNLDCRKKVIFEPSLISFNEAATGLGTYFRQRIRVSEGHTRGFRRRIWTILTSKIPAIDKVEFFFTGLHYAKSISILALILFDISLLMLLLLRNDNNLLADNSFILPSLSMQAVSLSFAIITNIISVSVLEQIEKYSIKHVLYLLTLNLFTVPALALGSILGLIRNRGYFYRTRRNIY
jgi:cellulose synthase/poly-beta-1,6-N-acetylglucosamine synthase-like glycosyltransferase